ncbi:MAG: hypothetical protein HDT46_08425 [Ruminococcaceae bacterium]|nr:hypothetical protein [Oscillospiraceae bacterium]
MEEKDTPYDPDRLDDDLDILGRSDIYVDPLAAMFTQNMVVAPSAITGIPPFNPYNLRNGNEYEEEDELRK